MELVIDVGELKRIERAAITVLSPLVTAREIQMIAVLKPHDDDYAQIFLGDTADVARRAYQGLWEAPPKGFAKPTQTQVLASAATAESLRTENPYSAEFPGGYRKIADKLNSERIWVRFKFVEPGTSTGMAYDGLVWLDGRWAWFPKPWKYLTQTMGTDEN
jgi:hypothetical protein